MIVPKAATFKAAVLVAIPVKMILSSPITASLIIEAFEVEAAKTTVSFPAPKVISFAPITAAPPTVIVSSPSPRLILFAAVLAPKSTVSFPAPELISNIEAAVALTKVSLFDPEKTFVSLVKLLIVNFPVWAVATTVSRSPEINLVITKSFAPLTTIVSVALFVIKSVIVTVWALPLASLANLPAVSKTVSTFAPVVTDVVWLAFTSNSNVPVVKVPLALSIFATTREAWFLANTNLEFSFTVIVVAPAPEIKTSLTSAFDKSVKF